MYVCFLVLMLLNVPLNSYGHVKIKQLWSCQDSESVGFLYGIFLVLCCICCLRYCRLTKKMALSFLFLQDLVTPCKHVHFCIEKLGIYRGIYYFLIFALKHRPWVHVRTASLSFF